MTETPQKESLIQFLKNRGNIYIIQNDSQEVFEMKHIFMILFDLGLNKGGKTSAVLNRSTHFYNYGYACDLVTFNYNSDYSSVMQQLVEDNKMDKRTRLYNLYLHFEEKSSSQNHKQNSKLLKYYQSLLKNTLDIIQSKYITAFFSSQTGELIARQHMSKTDNRNYILEVYENGLRVKNVYYQNNLIHKIRFYDTNEKLRSETFFDRNVNPYITRSFKPSGYLYDIFLFPDKKHFNNNVEFCSYFLDDLIPDNSDNIIICDGAGSFPKITNTQHKYIKKFAVLHSNHLNVKNLEKEKEVRILKESNKIDNVILLTESQKKDVISEYNVQNAEVISNFIRIKEKFETSKKNKTKIVGTISRIVKTKGFDYLINIAEKVVNIDNSIEFHVYGEGPYTEHIENTIQKKDLQDNFKLMGYTNNPDETLASFNAFISTSQIEGQGLSIIEAMLQEKPVIVYDIKYGPSDFVNNGKNGFLIRNKDIEKMTSVILCVVNDNKLAENIGKEARLDIIEKYNSEKIMSKWTSLF